MYASMYHGDILLGRNKGEWRRKKKKEERQGRWSIREEKKVLTQK